MKLLVSYLIAASCCAGYLNSFNSFLEAPWKLSTSNIAVRSIVWPWTLGEILCGVYIGENWDKFRSEKSKPELKNSPEEEVVEPDVFEGALRV